MPYDLADLKKIKIHIKRDLPTMASTSDVDYSFSNNEKLPIHNQDMAKEESINITVEESPSSEIRAASIEVLRDIQNPSPGSSKMENSKDKSSLSVNEAIDKIEKILESLKKQKTPEYRRVVRHTSKKRFRNKNTKPLTSTDISSDDSDSSRSPSLKRMKKDSTQSTRMKYDSDSSVHSKKNDKYPDRSSSSSSDRSLSCVSKHLKKELSNFLGDSFVSINSSKKRSRKTKRDRSRNPERNDSNERSKRSRYDSRDRSKYSRRNYSRDNSRSEEGHSYDSYSRRRLGRQERHQNYDRNYQQVKAKDVEERYSRYYAVMYAFSIIMDILRQDDIYSTF